MERHATSCNVDDVMQHNDVVQYNVMYCIAMACNVVYVMYVCMYVCMYAM